jgi:hypothetical protein
MHRVILRSIPSGATSACGAELAARFVTEVTPCATVWYIRVALFLRFAYGGQWGNGLNPDLTAPIDLAVAETMTEVETDRHCNAEVDTLWQQGLDEYAAAARKATLWRSSVPYVWNARGGGAYPYQYQRSVHTPLERVWLAR